MQITINNKLYDLAWGLGAIEIYCDAMDCDIDGLSYIGDNTDLKRKQKAITYLILAAIQNGLELKNEVLDVSYRTLQLWISEADQKLFNEVMDNFMKSRYFGKTVSEHIFGIAPTEEPVKKKSRSVK
jgi:hypothetical protein